MAKSFENCGGPHDLSSAHSASSWESKSTTCAERAVIRYLTEVPSRHRGKALLHVGIGNGALFAATGSGLRSFTGITISRPELDQFQRTFNNAANAHVILANKHDERTFASIGEGFDLIVDVNLKSFACCETHFMGTMLYFAQSLRPRGQVLTAQSGLDFGWGGNTATAYTPGADPDPRLSAQRILGAAELANLSVDLGLTLQRVRVPGTFECNAETLWILEKA